MFSYCMSVSYQSDLPWLHCRACTQHHHLTRTNAFCRSFRKKLLSWVNQTYYLYCMYCIDVQHHPQKVPFHVEVEQCEKMNMIEWGWHIIIWLRETQHTPWKSTLNAWEVKPVTARNVTVTAAGNATQSQAAVAHSRTRWPCRKSRRATAKRRWDSSNTAILICLTTAQSSFGLSASGVLSLLCGIDCRVLGANCVLCSCGVWGDHDRALGYLELRNDDRSLHEAL